MILLGGKQGLGRFSTHRHGGRKPGPKDKEDLYRRVVGRKRNGSLEFVLLGLLSACIGVLFFLVFFRG